MLQSRCLATLISRFDGEGYISKLIHVVVVDKIQFLTGCWTEGFA